MKPDEREIARRQRLVADICVRQMDHSLTLAEIAQRLHDGQTRLGPDGELQVDESTVSRNPQGEPWSVATIKRDVDVVKADWRAEAIRSVAEHKQEILAQYQQLLTIHWSNLDLDSVNKILKEIRVMLGTDTERIAVWEGVREQMDLAAKRLRSDFGHDPVLLTAIYKSISGASETTNKGVKRTTN